MMPALLEADRERLARLLGMLGSDHVGEVANAGRLADKLVRAAGLSWHDVVAPVPSHDEGAVERAPQDWRQTAATCSRFPHLLNAWEAEFIAGLPWFPRLSSKQRDCLTKIVVRLRACGCRV
jgi:hypothetical protein